MNNTVSLLAFLALTGAGIAPALADDIISKPMLPTSESAKVEAANARAADQAAQARSNPAGSQADSAAARAATQAAQAATVAAQAAQAAAQAAQAAAREAELLQQGGQRPAAPVQAVPAQQSGQVSPQPSMTREYRRITKPEFEQLEHTPPPSTTEAVVDGANIGDFLGSGVQLDRRAMDQVMDREYNSLVRLTPLGPGQVAPSVDKDVENARLAEAKKNQPKRSFFGKILHGTVNGIEDVGSMVGFPIGPDDDDARMDKFDDM